MNGVSLPARISDPVETFDVLGDPGESSLGGEGFAPTPSNHRSASVEVVPHEFHFIESNLRHIRE
jgi:hypothetical protein